MFQLCIKIFFSLSFSFTLWSAWSKVHYSAGSPFYLFIYLFILFIYFILFFFFLLSLGLVVWPRLGDLFVSKNLREMCVSHFPGWIMGCAYTICSYSQIQISCTIPRGSPCPPSRVNSYTLFALTY